MTALSAATGIDRASLSAHQPERLHSRQYGFRGHHFSAGFLAGTRTTYCPQCLLTDDQRVHGNRVGRWAWLFKAVRTCGVHGCALQLAEKKAWSDQIRDLHAQAPRGGELRRLADLSELRSTSPLQDYVISRLRGQAGSAPWLDCQGIEQAYRATEMVGVLAGWGAGQKLGAFTDRDWDRAGRLGFAVTAAGEGEIRSVLHDVLRGLDLRHGRVGAHTVFGFFYEWLQFNKSGRDPGPIRAILREFILENMAVTPGMDLLGEKVVNTRRHHAHSLAVKYGLHPKTVHRALVSKGLIASADPEKMTGMDTCDAQEAEKLAEELQCAIPVAKLPEHMNATRPQVDILLREGFLRPLDNGHRVLTQVLRGVDARDADHFLARLISCAVLVPKATAEFVPIPTAAQEAKRYSGDIVRAMLDGDLSRVEMVKGTAGYLALLVNPSEVRLVLPRKIEHLALTKKAAADQIGVSLTALDRLLGLKGNSPLMEWVEDRLPGPIKVRIEQAEVDRFKQRYVTLGELIRSAGSHHQVVRRNLTAAGVNPVQDPKEIGVYLYERRPAIAALA